MRARSPIRQAFSAIAHQPALPLAEITWRWCFAAAAWFVGIVAFLEYLNSVSVSGRERMLLESSDPLLAIAAVAHALRGSALRFSLSIICAATAIAILWMLAAALGRLITLQALLPGARLSYRPLLGLSFLRAALFFPTLLAAAAAIILAGFAAPAGDPAPSLVLAAVLCACIWLVWVLLNWLLSVAAIFAARDGEDTFGSVRAAVDLVRAAFGGVVLASLPFVLLHYLALAAALASGVLIFDLIARVSPNVVWALFAIAVAYFAYADFLYVTRLAAYVSLAGPGEEPASVSAPAPSLQPADLPGAAQGALLTADHQLPATDYHLPNC